MSLSLEHIDAFLPITALKTFVLDDRRFIFQSHGTFFRVVDETTGVVAAQVQIFKRNNIHGFITLNERLQDHDSSHVQIIVWGGRSVRAVNLFLASDNEVTLSASSAEFTAPDWIMSGCAAAADGHYGAFFITSNNALLSLEVLDSEVPGRTTTISIYQLATSVKSILYSADVIALSASHVLIAAGTVFGEIIVWSCFLNKNGSHKANAIGSIHHFFTGHDGSIFGVRISPQIPSLNGGQSGRILASCSDDRTVRIWDISDCEHKTAQDPSAYSTDGFDLRSTGFGSVEAGEESVGSESCVVQAFAHTARIWGVHFRAIKNNNQTHMGLVSHGEDCTCVLWDLSWHSSSAGTTEYQLTQTSSIKTHFGKHIWSLDLCRIGSETVVYTGGADGALKSFPIKENDDEHLGSGPVASLSQSPSLQVKMKENSTAAGTKAFAFVTQDYLLRTSTQGHIELGYLNQAEETAITWETICETPDLASFGVMTALPQMGLVLIGNCRGFIRLYNHASKSVIDIADVGNRPLGIFFLQTHSSRMDPLNSSKKISFVVCYPTGEEITLVNVSDWNSDHPSAETFTFSLPSTFVVCSASFIFDGQYLIIGSKLGALAIYNTSEAEPLLVNRRVHGREFVNHISVVTSATTSDGIKSDFVLTCGRDGTYCLHELQFCGDGADAVSIQTVHRTASMTGGNIEGAYFDKATGDFMLYGFRSQDFVLRNESKLTDIVSIASGGFRRGWDFIPGDKKDNALFTWKDGTSLMTTRIRASATTLLRAGAHGREIKAIGVFNPTGADRPVFATGAEDTTVRLFMPTSSSTASPWGSFECLRVLDTHKSGIQQVTWSKDGKYLFTSAAYEEFFVWKVRAIPIFGVATKLLAASPKDDVNSDLRIPSFDLLEVEEVDGERGFLLCLALSNSVFKIFHFSPSNGGQFTLLARGKYMTNCLTQAHFLVTSSSVSLITAATDGHFTLWDLTSTLEPFYTITKSALKAKQTFDGSSISPENITCESRYQIHSNSIKGMELVPISDTATVVVAGGDDNSLSVSLLRTHPSNTGTNAHVATVSIPDSHAAAATTVKVLNQQISRDVTSNTESIKITVASSGNDYRVKIWLITVDPAQPGTEGIIVRFLRDTYSSVADIASLGLVHGPGNSLPAESQVPGSEIQQSRLVVCGVGIEMFAAESDQALSA
ncbi:WD40/YVTN repeat-like-containing domain [Penicillium camemberti]|uniref:WD40/YVTN repeat-like-containing domain n=1 Tax=Penicillium camemberti (strain FM 013) TaxID=1429867 RepID=A0A0G4NSN8_PENC3|nr:WD40/YVTN repeat-like-containing domain [Penicillium camemberti]